MCGLPGTRDSISYRYLAMSSAPTRLLIVLRKEGNVVVDGYTGIFRKTEYIRTVESIIFTS